MNGQEQRNWPGALLNGLVSFATSPAKPDDALDELVSKRNALRRCKDLIEYNTDRIERLRKEIAAESVKLLRLEAEFAEALKQFKQR